MLQKSSAVVRARAADALAQLGDPRFDPTRFHLPTDPMLGFVHIAADPTFKIGTRKADAKRVEKITGFAVHENEINDQATPAPEFYIARYLVTVAQFRAFIDATKFKLGDEDALRDPGNRALRFVSWHDALAYCDWPSNGLSTAPILADSHVARLVRERGWRVGLPSELEWEKAARGNLRDAVFSWGDNPDPNAANYADTDINTTSGVGCFAANDFGLYDMLGNVWEWTSSNYKDYPYRVDDGRENLQGKEARLVRGSSWGNNVDDARCAYRGWDYPDLRVSGLGFRVVLRPPPVR